MLSGFVKGKVSITREKMRIYDQYLIVEIVFAGLTFINLFPTPSLFFFFFCQSFWMHFVEDRRGEDFSSRFVYKLLVSSEILSVSNFLAID